MFEIPEQNISIIGQKGFPKEFIGTSGVEAYVEQKALELKKRGKKVRCYVRKWTIKNSLSSYKGIEIVELPSLNTKFFDAITSSFVASVHASFSNTSAVWYQGIGPGFFSFIPFFFGKKVYLTIHSLDWKRKKWNRLAKSFLLLSEKISVRFSAKIFVVSNSLKEYVSNNYGVIATYEPYVIKERSKVNLQKLKLKYGLETNRYVLYLGRFVPEKRIEWLIQAHQHMNHKKIKLVLAGDTSHSDAYTAYLKKAAKKNDRSIIFTGYVFGKEKDELISNCKVFVLPSELEGFPIAILEALSYGRTCLVGDFLREEQSMYKTIKYFISNDFNDFYEKLKQIISK